MATVYRFNDLVALHFDGSPTIYLPQRVADEVAQAIKSCSTDIGSVNFTSSTFKTVDIEENT